MNESIINRGGDCRTAPSTAGQLKHSCIYLLVDPLTLPVAVLYKVLEFSHLMGRFFPSYHYFKSLKGCVLVKVLELHYVGSATNGATTS